jgi:hypothetical protein
MEGAGYVDDLFAGVAASWLSKAVDSPEVVPRCVLEPHYDLAVVDQSSFPAADGRVQKFAAQCRKLGRPHRLPRL